MKRECILRLLRFAILLFVSPFFLSCNKVTPERKNGENNNQTPAVPNGLPEISTYKVGDVVNMKFKGQFLLACNGIDKTDYLELVARDDAAQKIKINVSKVDNKGALFDTPPNFVGGMFGLVFYKGGKAVNLGTTFVQVVDSTEVPRVSGSTTYGRVIDVAGNPVAGVSVSDGVFVTTTNAVGQYYLSSTKKNGYVFISVPSGYKVAVNRTIPQFFQRLEEAPSVYEQRNFILAPEDNTRFRMIIFTDTHLANRTKDITQFTNGFKTDLKNEIARAKSERVKLYAMSLGDLTWDEYWYVNNYRPVDYFKQMEDLDIPIHNIPGNHDNDPYVADDFLSEMPWRKHIGPTYFSFNLGNVHFVQMDNTLFSNTGGTNGTIGNLNYSQGFTPDQLRWLEADLKNVPVGKTVILGIHIQYTNRYKIVNDALTWEYSMPANFRIEV
ncbi:MAG TPA: metallophosphoesterase N-terminal domain-containing protein, partial [Sphingobacterium sp.]|nr:metallophosphoesterase N-terminal domain-containing protein [Sphingobacterium sp.]